MTEKTFFKHYLPALEMALERDDINDCFSVKGPDWYIEDDIIRNEVDLFFDLNYDRFKPFFEKIALYFDAKSHNFSRIEGVDIEEYKKRILEYIEEYRRRWTSSPNT